jgi:hypothetical protein
MIETDDSPIFEAALEPTLPDLVELHIRSFVARQQFLLLDGLYSAHKASQIPGPRKTSFSHSYCKPTNFHDCCQIGASHSSRGLHYLTMYYRRQQDPLGLESVAAQSDVALPRGGEQWSAGAPGIREGWF